ncbi:MAG: ABC-F type ribosomal protection protein [bacterium]|nr:ABC-F type ribosomal protection protein [bacterium]
MIVIKNLTTTIYGKSLFQDMSIIVHQGQKIGIIGPNGCGKSTLLKIIAGHIKPDQGSVSLDKEIVGYLPQQIEADEQNTLEDYLELHAHPQGWVLLGKLALDDIDLTQNIHSLSGGQKTRLALIKTLYANPTVLLMDEPTNNLDSNGIEWLESFIQQFPGSVLIVSHDRAFLNATVSRIVEFDPVNNRIEEYRGNYDGYLAERDARRAQWEKNYELQQREKRRLEQWLALKRQEASIFVDPAKGRQVRMMEKRIQREIYDKAIAKPTDNKIMKRSRFSGNAHSGKLLLRVLSLSKSFDGHPLFRDISFEIRGHDRYHIAGSNGTGKSSLLKIIMGQTNSDNGTIEHGENVRVGYFSQENDTLDTTKTILDEIMKSNTSLTLEKARAVLGSFLFPADDIYKTIGSLSFGERVRLSFAKLMQKEHDLLILDEPTNHLDIPSREAIEHALEQYQGGILVVSHDRYFLKQLGELVECELENGKLKGSGMII